MLLLPRIPPNSVDVGAQPSLNVDRMSLYIRNALKHCHCQILQNIVYYVELVVTDAVVFLKFEYDRYALLNSVGGTRLWEAN